MYCMYIYNFLQCKVKKYEENRKEYQRMAEQNGVLKAKCDEISQGYLDSQDELKELRRTHEDIKLEHKKSYAALNDRFFSLNDAHMEAQNKYNDMYEKHCKLQGKHENMTQEYEKKAASHGELYRKFGILEQKHDDNKKNHDKLMQENMAMQEMNDKKMAEYQALQDEAAMQKEIHGESREKLENDFMVLQDKYTMLRKSMFHKFLYSPNDSIRKFFDIVGN